MDYNIPSMERWQIAVAALNLEVQQLFIPYIMHALKWKQNMMSTFQFQLQRYFCGLNSNAAL